MKFISVCVIAVSIVLMGYFTGSGLKNFRVGRSAPVAKVKGISEKVVKSDAAIWSIRFEAKANSFEAARNIYQKNVKDITTFLKECGFKEEEFSFTAPETFVDKEKESEKGVSSKVTVYSISSKAIVQTKNVDLVTESAGQVIRLLDKNVILTADDNTYYNSANPKYILSNFDEYRPTMLAEAVKSAKVMAQQFANDVGAKVGPIVAADQGQFSIQSDVSETEPEAGAIMKKIRVVSTLTYALID